MNRVRWSRSDHTEVFADFTDVTEVGAGSLSTVYRAREAGTNRLVALKLLNVRDASPRALESFDRETVALGAVSSHPHIVTLYRTFRAGDGRPVLVLELCRESVADRLRARGGLPAAEVVALGIKIAGALETAHGAGILHRDVKPQNILITDYGQPALADFGVAMLQSSTQTTAGLFDFTTLHVAPELLEGGETSPATDVYELASSLYQLVAGRSAFRSYDGESPASVILRILRDPVQPVGGAEVPVALSDLLVRAMAKDKDRRPPTAAEFAAELAGVEAAQGWAPTSFALRDGRGADISPPPPVAPPPAARPAEPPAHEPPAEPPADEPPAEPPTDEPPADELPADETPADEPPADETLLRYPIPPIRTAAPVAEPAVPTVPMWAVRTQADVPSGQAALGDLALDPSSLGRRVTIRANGSALSVDDAGLSLRSRLRRTELPWGSVHGFRPHVDGHGQGELTALTDAGAVELPATRRSAADLRYVHALLEAYRQRFLARR